MQKPEPNRQKITFFDSSSSSTESEKENRPFEHVSYKLMEHWYLEKQQAKIRKIKVKVIGAETFIKEYEAIFKQATEENGDEKRSTRRCLIQ